MHYLVHPDGRISLTPPRPLALLSGSFRPLHDGHRGMREAAARRLCFDVHYEISIKNVEKPEVEPHDLHARLKQFEGHVGIYVTRAATFIEKAELFPGSVFVVGADTAIRIIDPKFYGDDLEKRDEALEGLKRFGNRFLVAGRCDVLGHFVGLDEIPLPQEYMSLFEGIPETEFRADVSSTQLRRI